MTQALYDCDEAQAARIIGVSPRTLAEYRRKKLIGHHRLPGGRIRYTLDQLADFTRSTRVDVAPCLTLPPAAE